MTVGLGSRPDRDGFVTLDAAIMTDDGRAGCVAFVQGVAHPISLARLVMEKTPHVLLAGAGAEQFARECGIEVAPPKLTPEAERQWRAWLVEKKYEPKVNIENHDTISMLALDTQGRMAAASTTTARTVTSRYPRRANHYARATSRATRRLVRGPRRLRAPRCWRRAQQPKTL
jgi:isoaspartyl peptidase/L-asparaginase-like protein (Ntn-hydrolase superfamily)